ENQENQKGKGPDWMFDLDLLTPSMNYIPVRKENYADSKEQGITCDDAEDYVKDILNKFDFRTIKPASTPIEAHKSIGKDEEGEDVDVHLYRSMIGCLMYLTASRGLSIPGPTQTQPQQPTQGTDPKDKGKGIFECQTVLRD
ncbi:hypothetical protein Tco_0202599, partial [Tanacetum coccineum]